MPNYIDEMMPVPNFRYSMNIGEPTEYLDENSELASLQAAHMPDMEFNPGGQMQMPTGRTMEVPGQQPQRRPGRSNAQRIMDSLPGIVDAAAAAVATPNRAFGGATDIASAFMSGRQAVRENQMDRMRNDAFQNDQFRRDLETEAELAMRQRQVQMAEAQHNRAMAPERMVEVDANLARQAGIAVPPGQRTAMVPIAIAQQVVARAPKQGGQQQPAAQQQPDRFELDSRATGLGLMPGTYEYQYFMSSGGKMPSSRPPQPRPNTQQQQQRPRTAEQVFLDPNSSPEERDRALQWKTAGKGGKKEGSSSPREAPGLSPTKVAGIEQEAQARHSARAKYGQILAVPDGSTFVDPQTRKESTMNPELRRHYRSLYDAATAELQLRESQLGRQQTVDQPQQQAAPPQQRTAAPPSNQPNPKAKYVPGQGLVYSQK